MIKECKIGNLSTKESKLELLNNYCYKAKNTAALFLTEQDLLNFNGYVDTYFYYNDGEGLAPRESDKEMDIRDYKRIFILLFDRTDETMNLAIKASDQLRKECGIKKIALAVIADKLETTIKQVTAPDTLTDEKISQLVMQNANILKKLADR
jgi:hypothetical protein